MTRSHRRGFSVLEVVIAIAVLAGSIAALMQLNSQEGRSIEMSEERLTAIMLLTEMQQTMSGRSYDYFKDFPTNEAGFDALFRSMVIEEHPTVFDERDTSDTRPFAQHLRTTMDRMKVDRFVLIEPFTTAAGTNALVVKYLVHYQGKAGVRKTVSTFEVVYQPPPP